MKHTVRTRGAIAVQPSRTVTVVRTGVTPTGNPAPRSPVSREVYVTLRKVRRHVAPVAVSTGLVGTGHRAALDTCDQLDAADWDAAERARIIDEIRRAYRLNTAILSTTPTA